VLNALWSLHEVGLLSGRPSLPHGKEPVWLSRNVEHRRELKALRAEQREARQLNRVDRAERGWLSRRLARD